MAKEKLDKDGYPVKPGIVRGSARVAIQTGRLWKAAAKRKITGK